MVADEDDRAIELRAKIEREEREITGNKHPLFSKAKGRMVSIPERIREMDAEYEELMFVLSDSSNESIRTIKQFSVEEVTSFTRQLNLKYKRQKDARSDSTDTD